MADPKPYEVYAIRYATVARKGAENFIGGDPHEAGDRMDYFVWLARNDERAVVIDTGFNAEAAKRRKRDFLRSPADGLKLLGVDAETVKDVIVTHLHYDHIGNFDLFPAAQFHLQDREMAYATGRHMGTPFFSHAYELDEILGMVRNVYAGRVAFHDGMAEIAPGLTVHHVGGHTLGLQIVRVWTKLGWIVLASDASHYYRNMEEGRPFPVVANIPEMVDGWKFMRTLVSDPKYIVAGHDPIVMERYSPPSPDLDGIVVRLDAEPVL